MRESGLLREKGAVENLGEWWRVSESLSLLKERNSHFLMIGKVMIRFWKVEKGGGLLVKAILRCLYSLKQRFIWQKPGLGA